MRAKILNHLSEQDCDRFAHWAFGEDYLEISGYKEFAKAWNRIHSEMFLIDFSNTINSDLMEMIDLWNLHENYDN